MAALLGFVVLMIMAFMCVAYVRDSHWYKKNGGQFSVSQYAGFAFVAFLLVVLTQGLGLWVVLATVLSWWLYGKFWYRPQVEREEEG